MIVEDLIVQLPVYKYVSKIYSKNVLLYIIISSIFFNTACISDPEIGNEIDSNPWSEIKKLDQNKFYDLATTRESNFDGALFHRGAYIAYKTDTINSLYIYFVSRWDIKDSDGIFVVLKYDGSLFAFGHPEQVLYTCGSDDGSVYLIGNSSSDDNFKIISQSNSEDVYDEHHINNNTQLHSKGYDPKSWIKFGLSNVPYLSDFMNLYDLSKAWNGHDSFEMTTNLFTTGISYLSPEVSISVGPVLYEWEQQCNEFLRRLYGNIQAEIVEVIPISNNKCEVIISVANASDIAKPFVANIEDYFGSRQISAPREIYLAVFGSLYEYATIDFAYTISDEVLLENSNNDPEIRLSITLDVPIDKITYLRPYFISYVQMSGQDPIVKSFKLFKKQYLYGPDYSYFFMDVDLSWKQTDARGKIVYDKQTNEGQRSIDFQIEVAASRHNTPSDISIVDWGYIIIDENGNTYDHFSFVTRGEGTSVSELSVEKTINYTCTSNDLFIDDNNYIATTNDWKICPFFTYLNSHDWVPTPKMIFGIPIDFKLYYNEVPKITFSEPTYLGSDVRSWASSINRPICINSDEGIYAYYESFFETPATITGAFFIKNAHQCFTGINKYCDLYYSDHIFFDFQDGNGYDFSLSGIRWKSPEFSNSSKWTYCINFTAINSRKYSSNMIYFSPIKHVDDDGKSDFFGFYPSL